MNDDLRTKAAATVLMGIVGRKSDEQIKRELLELGLSKSETTEMLAKGAEARQVAGGQFDQPLADQGMPKTGSVQPNGEYFELPITPADRMLCSDRECPCPGHETLVLGESGYLYVNEAVVKMRADALTWEELANKIKQTENEIGGKVFYGAGTANPILMCEQGARLRNLDLKVAAADAENWGKTQTCPLRATPSADHVATKKWWQFWR